MQIFLVTGQRINFLWTSVCLHHREVSCCDIRLCVTPDALCNESDVCENPPTRAGKHVVLLVSWLFERQGENFTANKRLTSPSNSLIVHGCRPDKSKKDAKRYHVSLKGKLATEEDRSIHVNKRRNNVPFSSS